MTKVHREALRFAEEGYTIVLVGHDGHEEVEGTMGEAPERIVLVQNEQDVDELQVEDPERIAYITQTTLSVDETSSILARLKERFPAIVGPRTDDICYATTNRQTAVKQLAGSCDLMLVIGSRNSSNSVRLVEVARDFGTDAHLIDSASEVREEWLDGQARRGHLLRRQRAREPRAASWSASSASGASQDISEVDAVREDVRFMLPKQVREVVARGRGVLTRTLIVSDLHLGSGLGSDVLRRPGPRAALLEALEDVDRLVLLGDVLELRHRPPRYAMAAARPFFEDLGQALAGREIVMSAGNHDHPAGRVVARRARAAAQPEPLGLEQRLLPEQASPMLAQLAEWAAPAQVSVAYPGLWVRPDVYATHGHYLDCHLTVPTIERLSVAAMSRSAGPPGRVLQPRRGLRGGGGAGVRVARRRRQGSPSRATSRTVDTIRAWRALSGDGERLFAACASCAGSRSRARSRSPSRRSTAPGWGRCGPTSRPRSCAARGCARWARWPSASAWATPT